MAVYLLTAWVKSYPTFPWQRKEGSLEPKIGTILFGRGTRAGAEIGTQKSGTGPKTIFDLDQCLGFVETRRLTSAVQTTRAAEGEEGGPAVGDVQGAPDRRKTWLMF